MHNIGRLAVWDPAGSQSELNHVERAALRWENGRITWCGREEDLPVAGVDETRIDAGESLVVPGLVDCHTHLAFGGWRADEFAMRIAGADYLEIARAGGGIASTMRATRSASEDELVERSLGFLAEMSRNGTTTVECKSGYGLSLEDELKVLRVYRRLQQLQDVRIVATFLGAHVVPPEFSGRRSDYIRLLTREMIPAIAEEGLAEYCDVFVEETAFTPGEAREIFEAALSFGLVPKLHADQLSDTGGAALAAEVGAASADHLEYASEDGIGAMAGAGVVAVCLPLASLYLGKTPMKAREFIRRGVRVAVATDFNPGSAPSHHLPLAMTLACTMSRMTPAEALKGATIVGAAAIRRERQTGSLLPGMAANFLLVDAPDVEHWLYHFRGNAVQGVFIGGKQVH
jgi:imidazolonepropionase